MFTYFAYLSYLWQAKNAFSIHSPFIFELYEDLIKSNKTYYCFAEIEKIRRSMLLSQRQIEVEDFGAGSKIFKSKERSIADIAHYSLAAKKEAELLFRLINYFQPQIVFDLGTSLGITSLYLSKASTKAQIFSFEGCKETSQIALENFKKMNVQNIDLIVGRLEETLQKKATEVVQIDFVFFDANHQYQATKDYFEICLNKAGENSIFIFDDIHWSAGMEKAWLEIKNHPKVKISIDLFSMGLVFFRDKQPKQHFILKF